MSIPRQRLDDELHKTFPTGKVLCSSVRRFGTDRRALAPQREAMPKAAGYGSCSQSASFATRIFGQCGLA